MNLILLEDQDFTAPARCVLRDARRVEHVVGVLGAREGDTLCVGRLGGDTGTGTLVRLAPGAVELEVRLDAPPPPPCRHRLALALPRPPTLRKVLQQAAALGVKQIDLFHARRVEKSYWQSHALAPAELGRQLRLGLEQARDTRLPEVRLQRRFRPFVEDVLAARPGPLLLADAGARERCPVDAEEPATLLIGPEGGLIPFELELLESAGGRRVALGPRALRVETAVVAALGRLG